MNAHQRKVEKRARAAAEQERDDRVVVAEERAAAAEHLAEVRAGVAKILEQDLSVRAAECDAWKRQISDLNERFDAAVARCEDLNRRLATEELLAAARADDVRRLEEEIAGLRELDRDAGALRRRLREREAELDRLRTELSQAKAAVAAARFGSAM